jgi:hypothetical protein
MCRSPELIGFAGPWVQLIGMSPPIRNNGAARIAGPAGGARAASMQV